jgi:hypothetical protein
MLRDKFHENLEEDKEWDTDIEDNMLSSNIEPSSAPIDNTMIKYRVMNNTDPIPDSIVTLSQKFGQMKT